MIEVLNLQHRYWVNAKRLRDLLARLIEKYGLGEPEVTLALVETRRIRKLNRDFRKRDAPTDVLSFPGPGLRADGKFYLGDIAISVPQAFQSCFREAHGLEVELADLAVHGFLHLLGFDHGKGLEEEEIKARRELGMEE
ncbi:MAG: rRNA maturation RNase YbeY [Acidobacteriota bacterium]